MGFGLIHQRNPRRFGKGLLKEPSVKNPNACERPLGVPDVSKFSHFIIAFKFHQAANTFLPKQKAYCVVF
jgi:hypothetical protein